MKEVFNNMMKHPIRTAIVIGTIASGITSIVAAVAKAEKTFKST